MIPSQRKPKNTTRRALHDDGIHAHQFELFARLQLSLLDALTYIDVEISVGLRGKKA